MFWSDRRWRMLPATYPLSGSSLLEPGTTSRSLTCCHTCTVLWKLIYVHLTWKPHTPDSCCFALYTHKNVSILIRSSGSQALQRLCGPTFYANVAWLTALHSLLLCNGLPVLLQITYIRNFRLTPSKNLYPVKRKCSKGQLQLVIFSVFFELWLKFYDVIYLLYQQSSAFY